MTEAAPKPRVFSGLQPTGQLHLGNYVGAISRWVQEQARYENIYCIVDLHALTIPEKTSGSLLWQKVRETAAVLLGCGIDPRQSALFVQSQVAAHTELSWLLSCVTPVGWLERMTQYKSKAAQVHSASAGLMAYPVLQAADILLYKAELVPVGEDQKQHVELARDIAQRFNHLFGEVFVPPREMIRPSGGRIMGLDDPSVKMSKSIGESRRGHSIGIIDPPDVIRRAILHAVTDSGTELRPEQALPGVRNLLTIYEAISGKDIRAVEAQFAGKQYSFLKRELADLVIATFRPIRERYQKLMADQATLDQVLDGCAARVAPLASATLLEARRVMGLEPPRC